MQGNLTELVSSLPNWSAAELLEAQKGVEIELKSRSKTAIKEAKKEILDVAKRHGLKIEDIISAQSTKEPVAVKYRNPDNPEQTWTGRGKKPTWLNQAMREGYELSDFKVEEGAK